MLSYTHNVGPSSFTNSVYQSPYPSQLPFGATKALPGHRHSLTWSDKIHSHVKCLENILSFRAMLISTVILSVRAGDLDTFVAFVGCFAWYVNSCSRCFADNYIGFVAYAMSDRPRCITRRVRTDSG